MMPKAMPTPERVNLLLCPQSRGSPNELLLKSHPDSWAICDLSSRYDSHQKQKRAYSPASIALIKLLGRMSVQFLSTHSRHVFRVSFACAILHPSGILINAGHSEYCPSSFTNT